jgi:hypothetical protein
MKLTDQEIPPEFQDQMAQIMTTLPSQEGQPAIGRTRRGARLPVTRYTARRQLLDIADAAGILADRLGKIRGSEDWKNFVHSETRAILRGNFNAEYWTACQKISEIHLTSNVISEPDPAPPPYFYRDPSNLPTIAEYPDGEVTDGPPAYAGLLSDGYFGDTVLTWVRSTYRLNQPLKDRSTEPTFLAIHATMHMESDKRGSRPMTSMIAKIEFGPHPDFDPASASPPLENPKSFYWRYKTPQSPAPYYELDFDRRAIARIFPDALALEYVPLTMCTVALSPRPLFGKGYNNNQRVNIELEHDTTVYQIATYVGQDEQPAARDVNYNVWTYNVNNGLRTDVVTPPGTTHVAVAGNYFASTDGNARHKIHDIAGNIINTIDPTTTLGTGTFINGPCRGSGRQFLQCLTSPDPILQPVLARWSERGAFQGATSLTAPPWTPGANPEPAGVTSDGSFVLYSPLIAFYIFSAGGALRLTIPTPIGVLSYCVTRSGLWYVDASTQIKLVNTGTLATTTFPDLENGGGGLSPYENGIYCNIAAAGWGKLTADGKFQRMAQFTITGAMMGETRNKRP